MGPLDPILFRASYRIHCRLPSLCRLLPLAVYFMAYGYVLPCVYVRYMTHKSRVHNFAVSIKTEKNAYGCGFYYSRGLFINFSHLDKRSTSARKGEKKH